VYCSWSAKIVEGGEWWKEGEEDRVRSLKYGGVETHIVLKKDERRCLVYWSHLIPYGDRWSRRLRSLWLQGVAVDHAWPPEKLHRKVSRLWRGQSQISRRATWRFRLTRGHQKGEVWKRGRQRRRWKQHHEHFPDCSSSQPRSYLSLGDGAGDEGAYFCRT